MAFNELFERDFLRMVLHREYLVEFAGVIEPEMFSFPLYGTLWLIIQKFYFEHKEAPSAAALFELLDDAVKDGLFSEDEIDFLEKYVPPIINIDKGEVMNFEFVRERVSKWAQGRRLRARVAEVVQKIQEGAVDVDEVIHLLKGAVLPKPLPLDEEDFVSTLLARVQNLVDRHDGLYIPTGIRPLDDALGGGLRRRNKGYIMGPPGGGKSTFCGRFAGNCVGLNLNVAYFYNDESSESLTGRLAGYFANISARDFLKGGSKALEKAEVASHDLAQRRMGKLILKQLPNLAKPSDVIRVVDRMVEDGTSVDVIIVDHIGKMSPEMGMSRDSYHLDVKNIFAQLSELCLEYDCVVLCVMHTNRKGGGKARLDDTLMGLTFEPAKEADFGLGAFRLTEDKGEPGPLGRDFGRIQIIKARGPGAGMLFRIEIDFERCKFKEVKYLGIQEGVSYAAESRTDRSTTPSDGGATQQTHDQNEVHHNPVASG
ncbi:hypothetical protein LCGC14_1564030 [marine sediment metagenome]|uniref:AAA+ ATPase domain-containing protein n=1 Tax=marine sediment metagenome TaxID=412755 RepID=A0A0F9ILN5_9ZZZZ